MNAILIANRMDLIPPGALLLRDMVKGRRKSDDFMAAIGQRLCEQAVPIDPGVRTVDWKCLSHVQQPHSHEPIISTASGKGGHRSTLSGRHEYVHLYVSSGRWLVRLAANSGSDELGEGRLFVVLVASGDDDLGR